MALTLLWIILNENDVFEWVGTAHRFVAAEFLCATLMELLTNAVLYYPFMNVAFGYMGIILGLSLLFVFPTEERYQSEYKMLRQTNELEK